MSTLWLVPCKAAGLAVQGPFDELGLRGNDSSPVVADNVKVPLSAMLGTDGGGFDAMLQIVLPTISHHPPRRGSDVGPGQLLDHRS